MPRAASISTRPLNCGVMRVISAAVLLLVTQALAACFPLPHRERVAPEITGVLRDHKQPAAGMKVYYAHRKRFGGGDSDCGHSDAVATTGSDGRFAFQAGKEFRFFVSMGDPTYAYEICAERNDARYLLWHMDDFGFVETPVELTCDLDGSVSEAERGRGRCSVRYPRWDKS
jgi:hypothetical protein